MLIPVGCNTHTVAHFPIHRKGHHHSRRLRVHSRFAGDGCGIAHFAPLGEVICHSQLLYGSGGTGKHRQIFVIDQILKAADSLLIEHRQILGLSGSLTAEGICQIPIVNRSVGNGFIGTLSLHQADVLRNGAGILVHTEDTGVQHGDQTHHRQHPAEQLNGIPLENKHQNNGRNANRCQCHQNRLPYAESHFPAPAGHEILNQSGDIGVDHVHQIRVGLGKFPEGPGNRGKNGSNQITSPIFQRIHLLINCIISYFTVYHTLRGLSAPEIIKFLWRKGRRCGVFPRKQSESCCAGRFPSHRSSCNWAHGPQRSPPAFPRTALPALCRS